MSEVTRIGHMARIVKARFQLVFFKERVRISDVYELGASCKELSSESESIKKDNPHVYEWVRHMVGMARGFIRSCDKIDNDFINKDNIARFE
jgi:hypothetical protein